MVERLSDEFEFHIVTSDRDLSDDEPYPSAVVDAWNRVGKAEVFYTSPKRQSLRSLARIMRETPHDVLYLNSFFSPQATVIPLVARGLRMVPRLPVVIAPRGEFSRGALGIKVWKKRAFILLSRAVGLYRGLTWQASSTLEVEDIQRVIGRTAGCVEVAPNLSPLPARSESKAPLGTGGGPLRVVFLSRIARKKNLDFAVRVLQNVTEPVEMSVYGVMEDEGYWRKCQSMIEDLPSNVTVNYGGAVPHERVVETLQMHDLFFFPTLGENYGHVIREGLEAGLPVLISDQTPWRNLEEAGVGWDLPLDAADRFAAVIDAQARLSLEDRSDQRDRTKTYAAQVGSDAGIVEQNVALFRNVLARGAHYEASGRRHVESGS
ncbi:MAG: glycosyltransferase [Coriobacteriia bacterium]|nr:glycosyltransferase [Coriobacteriia bacterium]